VAANRLAFSQGHELAAHQATAVALTPGWLRSEMMLDVYGVTEENWRDALRERGTERLGRVVDAAASDEVTSVVSSKRHEHHEQRKPPGRRGGGDHRRGDPRRGRRLGAPAVLRSVVPRAGRRDLEARGR